MMDMQAAVNRWFNRQGTKPPKGQEPQDPPRVQKAIEEREPEIVNARTIRPDPA
jgi:hypothetical protein